MFQEEETRDPERDRLDKVIEDFENRMQVAEDAIERARDELLKAEARARDLRETLQGLRRERERLDHETTEHLFVLPRPETAPVQADTFISFAPRREDGLLAILSSNPEHTWTYPELDEEFKRRGWDNPKAKRERDALRAAIYRLAKFDKVELGPERGEFRLKLPPASVSDSGGGSP